MLENHVKANFKQGNFSFLYFQCCIWKQVFGKKQNKTKTKTKKKPFCLFVLSKFSKILPNCKFEEKIFLELCQHYFQTILSIFNSISIFVAFQKKKWQKKVNFLPFSQKICIFSCIFMKGIFTDYAHKRQRSIWRKDEGTPGRLQERPFPPGSVFRLNQVIKKCPDQQLPCLINFIDFKAAFDSDRPSLRVILQLYGIPGKMINIIKSS